ncbi:MAG: hypothetical protein KKB20_02775 [Proteobacteria bacterium]|nr:hypothetical protein [Pseudomonadota bacterium]
MASNFKISRSASKGTTHLYLKGDFDGTSAYELIKEIDKACTKKNRILIYTNKLRKIYPFACGILQNGMSFRKDRLDRVRFADKKLKETCPFGRMLQMRP